MKPTTDKKPVPGSAALPLTYWLMLVCGLSVLTAMRIDEPEKMAPVWVGSLLGTAMGLLMARLRLRLWLFGFIVLNAMWIGALMLLPLWSLIETPAQPWAAAETCVLAFAPAALCGYLCLSERWTLAAFWFPAMLWMLAILDRSGGASLSGPTVWLLLSALGVLLLGFLRARESRRVALWQEHATAPLAEPSNRAVLREAPLGVAAQLVWMAGIGGATMLFTAWIAPHLFQTETVGHHSVAVASAARVAPNGQNLTDTYTCCPENGVADVERRRIREYLPLLHGQDEREATYVSPTACVSCVNGEPVAVATGPTSTSTSTPVPNVPPAHPTAAKGTGTAAPAVAPTVSPTKPGQVPKYVPPPAPKAPPVAAAPGRPAYAARTVATATGSDMSGRPLVWLLLMGAIATVLQVALRPLRRLMTLRHLGRPFWPETVDQRVSNLWQLMLVGLRDAGFRPAPGEQPGDLARRVGLAGMETCATVLERARHGVRVDVADLEAMSAAAREVYKAAREQAGPAARAVAWVRWPLV